MNDVELQTRNHYAATYLQHLQALALEISVAMDSIAANALTRLQQSVAKQETLCANLAAMTHPGSGADRSSHPPLLSLAGTAMDLKIRETSAAIRELNLQYAALLKHSGKSIALLASLCRTHTGQFQEARGPRLKHQTWSCEV